MLASRSISATAHQPVTRRAPCSALRPARLNIKAMATNQTSLNKDTPESVWKTILSAEDYRILRNKGTEAPGSGTYNKFYDDGTYVCKGCGTPLYTSEQKFNSGCGWPAYYDNIPGAVERHEDTTHGMRRVEITCSNCGGHLGHVFEGEGFPTPTDMRHCVNSASVKFKPKE
ncbi:Mss4-like protein [Haematococcus lacustris]